mgnify:CR=1 FL=1
MSRIILSAASRVGCVRTNNEDMVLAYDRLIRSDAYQTEIHTENVDRFVAAVADGMGGHLAGEVASEVALANLQFFINDLPLGLTTQDFNEAMVGWLRSVNHIIESKGCADRSMSDMGTTLVGMLYYGGKYYWVNCGDSRLYRLRDGKLTQLSTDHSLNNLTGQAKHSNVITNCIGGGCKNSYFDMYEFTADIHEADVYLLCSDGLNDMVCDVDIERMLVENRSANRLCEAAIRAGGFDNVSACVLEMAVE